MVRAHEFLLLRRILIYATLSAGNLEHRHGSQIVRLPVATENDPLIDGRLRNGTSPFNRRVHHRGIDGGASGRNRRRRTSDTL